MEDKSWYNVTVKFVNKSGKVFLSPNVEDISEVSRVDIVRKLSEPQYDKRGHLLFAEKMDDIYNIYWKEQFIIQFLYKCYLLSIVRIN